MGDTQNAITISAYTRSTTKHRAQVKVYKEPAGTQVQVIIGDIGLYLTAADARTLAESMLDAISQAVAA